MSANNTPLSDGRDNKGLMPEDPAKAKIRALNDQLRKTGIGGIYVMTRGVAALDEYSRAQVLLEIALEGDFDQENDPHNEHDFGKVEYEETIFLWKIDYYDQDLQFASKDPANAEITTRMMTVMLASEY